MAEPDWWARGLAIGSFLVSGSALYFARFDGRWRRRHAALQPLVDELEDLRAPVHNPGDHVQLRPLFSVTTGAALEMLDEAAERQPDRRLRPRLKSLVANLSAVRSAQQTPVTQLTAMQTKKLSAARRDLDWILKRAAKAARRGVQ